MGSNHILLTHKTQTIQPSDTPSQLGIDTTDFIGECGRTCVEWALQQDSAHIAACRSGTVECISRTCVLSTNTALYVDVPYHVSLPPPSALDGVVMEESISTTPSTLGGNEGGVLVKVQSQKDSEMYRIAKVTYYSRCTYRAVWWVGGGVPVGGGGWG